MVRGARNRWRARRWNHGRGWEFAGATGKDTALDGWPVNFWAHRWVHIGTQAELRDPLYGRRRMMPCYFVEAGGKRHAFAADELTDDEWVFFLPI